MAISWAEPIMGPLTWCVERSIETALKDPEQLQSLFFALRQPLQLNRCHKTNNVGFESQRTDN